MVQMHIPGIWCETKNANKKSLRPNKKALKQNKPNRESFARRTLACQTLPVHGLQHNNAEQCMLCETTAHKVSQQQDDF